MRVFLLVPVVLTAAFQLQPPKLRHLAKMSSSVATASGERELQADGLFKADRYVSTLRYLVPRDDEIDFEQLWAKKQTSMGTARGFRYFQMAKRAADFMGPPLPDHEPNYMSTSVWDSKEDFELFVAREKLDGLGG